MKMLGIKRIYVKINGFLSFYGLNEPFMIAKLRVYYAKAHKKHRMNRNVDLCINGGNDDVFNHGFML